MTVVNTGETALRAGDKVRMVIDVLDVVRGARHENLITGIPRTKVVARLKHLPETSSMFNDVADGVTSRQLTVTMRQPGVLTPKLEYMGRSRYPWDWNYVPGEDAAARNARLNQAWDDDEALLTAYVTNGDNGVANAAALQQQYPAANAQAKARQQLPRRLVMAMINYM